MPEITPDLSDTSRCISVHWSLPVQCVLPRAHRDNWHEAWHPKSGNRMRYRRAGGSTEERREGSWRSLEIPPPGGWCNEQNPTNPKAFCSDRSGHKWMHQVVYDGCTYTWGTTPSRQATVEQLTQDVRSLRERVAELESIVANAEKLIHGWTKSYAEHVSISHLDMVRDQPLMAGMQEGRANQYSDCANELRDVLDGEDPDGWEFGVGVEVASSTGGAA